MSFRPILFSVFLFLWQTLHAQVPETPKLPESIHVLTPKLEIAWKGCDFSANHFQNAQAFYFQPNEKLQEVSLKTGNFERHGRPDPENMLHQVRYKWSYTLEDKSFAVVSYIWEWVGASSSQAVVIQVWSCENGRPFITQQISGDGHASSAGADFDQRTQRMLIRSVNYGNGAHCCPEFLDRAIFHWTSRELQLTNADTIPIASYHK